MKTDIDYIKQLSDVMDEKSIIELSIEDDKQKISIKKGTLSVNTSVTPANQTVEVNTSSEIQTLDANVQAEKKLTPITSPMVGTFYSSASPDDTPFVRVGDVIRPGQVVCIIEAMKLMNEIEADVSGRVVEVCVENGQTIEFGQVLMYIE